MEFGKKEILTAVGTLGCAIAIGIIMQNSDTAEKRYGSSGTSLQTPAVSEEPLEDAALDGSVLDVRQIELTSAEFENSVELPSIEANLETPAAPQSVLTAPEVPTAAMNKDDCTIAAQARPVAAAMVNLDLEAPCLPNERVTIHHNGMIFTETTSVEGSLNLRVPALTKEAVFILAFSNGDGVVAQATVEEMDEFSRSVLQWRGNSGFQIHAREFGAGYGEEGHIWQGAPGDIADAVTGSGGIITRHGDPDTPEPLLAEVYTFPKLIEGRSGNVALSVETEVTETNCGLEVEAQALETDLRGGLKTKNMTLAVPDCDAVGTFLVLNNLLQDLKVAAK